MKTIFQPKIKYFLYARKSSESEDRQVQSIESQTTRLEQMAIERQLDVIKPYFTESKTAKLPDNRKVFEEMMQRIEKGEADGILCWSINRLSRNPIDSARIQWMLQEEKIKSILTTEKEYLPDDNSILYSVESSMASQYVRDLSKVVKRGMDDKVLKGWLPGVAPTGYINDKENKIIIKDPVRFSLIRKAWDLMLTGGYSIRQINDTLNNEWGYRSIKRKKIGGTPLALSCLYSIFTNRFYTGIFEYKGKDIVGSHEAMITLEEYDRVQKLLKKRGNPRPQVKNLPYRGFIRCGECGCMITGDTKTKLIKSTNTEKFYTYYACTRKRTDYECSQKKVMKKEELELIIEKELEKITILPEFRDKALEILNRENDAEIAERSSIYKMQHQTQEEVQAQLDRLTQMRFRDMITDQEFMTQRQELQNQLVMLKEQTAQTETRAEHWLELTIKTFNFATYAREKFINGDLQTKKEIAMALGQNFLLTNRNLTFDMHEWFTPIRNDYAKVLKQYISSEPTEKSVSKTKNSHSGNENSLWLG